MLCLLLMLNSRILGLIWRGRAYFVVNETTIFLPGEWRQRSKTELPKRTTNFSDFWRQIKSLKTSNVQIYPFVNLSMSLPNYKSLCLPSLVRNVARLQWPFDIRPTGTQIYRRFKVHELITCESKVQVVVSLGRHEVLFALGRHEDLTHDTWHALLQSENVFELGGITIQTIKWQMEGPSITYLAWGPLWKTN